MNHPGPRIYAPEAFAEQRRMLAGSWQLARATTAAAEPGWIPATAGMEPVLLTTLAGETRAFPNVCTHRGAILLEQPASTLRCPYHGRQFGPDGHLRVAPGCPALPFGEDLEPLGVDRLGPWTFVRCAGDAPFPDLSRWLDPASLAGLERDPAGDVTYTVRAHWALWVENYLEGLHVPYVHPGLRATLDLGAYRTHVEERERVVVQVGVAKQGPYLPLPAGHPAGPNVGGLYIFLFPGTCINVYAWGVSLNMVEPVSPTETRIHYQRWVAPADGRDVGGPGGALDDVEREDDTVVERVARGVAAVAARGGKLGSYVPTWEDGARAFHGWLSGA